MEVSRAIVIVSMILAAFKLALVLLLLSGLIFRPRETLSVLALGALFALWHYSLAAGAIVTGLLVLIALYGLQKTDGDTAA